MSRFAIGLVALVCLAAPTAAGASTLGGWDRPQQRTVTHAGVMAPVPGQGFAGDQPLTGAQLRSALAAIGPAAGSGALPATAAAVPDGPVTVAGFDRILVRQLSLADLARAVQEEAQRAGLAPPSRFGTEVVARQLGLRFNHPAGDDALELYPSDPITRAEAAWSFAQVLGFQGWETGYARQVFSRFQLPTYTTAQRQALHLAVSKIGMPYVWGGETDRVSTQYGYQAHGGYDCSGFVWRVFKLSGNPAGRAIGGRTADAMAREFPRSQRIRFNQIRPADVLFFGTPSYVGHVGIALSGDFMIHSSDQGVYVSPLFESWRRAEFVWARRLL